MNDSKLGFIAGYVFVFIAFFILVVISSLAISDYRKIESYDECLCFFNGSTDYDLHLAYYSYVDVETVALCNGEYLNVELTWPPGKKWYKRRKTEKLDIMLQHYL